jgi:hypothetical protein
MHIPLTILKKGGKFSQRGIRTEQIDLQLIFWKKQDENTIAKAGHACGILTLPQTVDRPQEGLLLSKILERK